MRDTHHCPRNPLEYMNYQLDRLNIDQQASPPINLRGRDTDISRWPATKSLNSSRHYYPNQTREMQIFALPVKTLQNAKSVCG